MKINYLKNFEEDHRISMNEYVNDLVKFQKKNNKTF